MNNAGPHGLSEVLYAFGEAANNNGSAFAGLNANVPWYNVMLGVAIIIGRFAPIVAALAIGLADTACHYVVPQAGSIFIFAFVFIVLIWRPNGIMRRR